MLRRGLPNCGLSPPGYSITSSAGEQRRLNERPRGLEVDHKLEFLEEEDGLPRTSSSKQPDVCREASGCRFDPGHYHKLKL
jgi:hypothetical protein